MRCIYMNILSLYFWYILIAVDEIYQAFCHLLIHLSGIADYTEFVIICPASFAYAGATICILRWLKCDMSLIQEAAKDVLKYVNVVLLCMLMHCLFFRNNMFHEVIDLIDFYVSEYNYVWCLNYATCLWAKWEENCICTKEKNDVLGFAFNKLFSFLHVSFVLT